MDTNAAIGTKVKNLRTEKKMTLKQLSEESGLSVGYLSQFERGLSSIALDSLEKLSVILAVPLSELFREDPPPPTLDPVVHGIELHFTCLLYTSSRVIWPSSAHFCTVSPQ